jgi:hypothetical protein
LSLTTVNVDRNDAKCAREITSGIAMEKAALSKGKTPFTGKLSLCLRKKPVKCYIWSIALCDSETRKFRRVDQKYLGSFEMEEISWTDHAGEGALYRIK